MYDVRYIGFLSNNMAWNSKTGQGGGGGRKMICAWHYRSYSRRPTISLNQDLNSHLRAQLATWLPSNLFFALPTRKHILQCSTDTTNRDSSSLVQKLFYMCVQSLENVHTYSFYSLHMQTSSYLQMCQSGCLPATHQVLKIHPSYFPSHQDAKQQ